MTQDLTKIDKPFGLLDPETQQAFRDYEGQLEFLGINDGKWYLKHDRDFDPGITYRAEETPLVVHDWDAIVPEIISVIRASNGEIRGYRSINELEHILLEGFSRKIIDPGTCDWKDAIAYRPGHEPGVKG